MYPRIEEQIKVISAIRKKLNIEQNGSLVYLTISGSHLYGFPSENSDVDYRGAFLTGEENLLGLRGKRDVVELNKPADIVVFELKKELSLALKSNCNIIEHINALPIYRTVEYLKMKRLVNNALGKRGLYNSYRGMALFNYRKFILRNRRIYKKYLYVFRGLMAGIYVLETGKIEPNLLKLNKYFKIKELDELIKLKIEGVEDGVVRESIDSGKLDELIIMLFERIDRAYIKSKIPEIPNDEEKRAIDNWLINLRLERIKKHLAEH